MQVCLPALLCMSLQWLLYALQVILNVNLPELVWDFTILKGSLLTTIFSKYTELLQSKKFFRVF